MDDMTNGCPACETIENVMVERERENYYRVYSDVQDLISLSGTTPRRVGAHVVGRGEFMRWMEVWTEFDTPFTVDRLDHDNWWISIEKEK